MMPKDVRNEEVDQELTCLRKGKIRREVGKGGLSAGWINSG